MLERDCAPGAEREYAEQLERLGLEKLQKLFEGTGDSQEPGAPPGRDPERLGALLKRKFQAQADAVDALIGLGIDPARLGEMKLAEGAEPLEPESHSEGRGVFAAQSEEGLVPYPGRAAGWNGQRKSAEAIVAAQP